MKKLLTLLLVILLASGCSSGRDDSVAYPSYEEGETELHWADYDLEEASQEASIEEAGQAPNQGDRMLTEEYNIACESKKYDQALEKIRQLVKDYEGYTTYVDQYNSDGKEIHAGIKTPSDKAQSFIRDLEGMEELAVTNVSKNSTDVTDAYRDNETRLDSLEKKLDRLYDLQEEQASLEELLMVENQINETIYEIETIKNAQANIDKQVKYTIVNFSMVELASEFDKSKDPAQLSFAEEVGLALANTGRRFVERVQDLVLALIYLLPYILILGLIIGLVILIVRRRSKDSKGRGEKKDDFWTEADVKYPIKKENEDKEDQEE